MAIIFSLWLPILLSAVAVFIVSSIIHMFFPYHRNDFKKVPDEDKTMDAMRKMAIPPGDYVVPYAGGSKEMSSSEYLEKLEKGPAFFMTMVKSGRQSMAGQFIQWFLYCVLIGIFAAYLTSRALGPGVYFLAVFRFVGNVAFLGYSLALLQNAIWYRRNWGATLKSVFDGLIYALVTAVIFGWLWPKSLF